MTLFTVTCMADELSFVRNIADVKYDFAFRLILSVLVFSIIEYCIPGSEVVDANIKLFFS